MNCVFIDEKWDLTVVGKLFLWPFHCANKAMLNERMESAID